MQHPTSSKNGHVPEIFFFPLERAEQKCRNAGKQIDQKFSVKVSINQL